MRAVIQRVKSSSVEINQKIKSEIEIGLLVLVGISSDDNKIDVEKSLDPETNETNKEE